MAKARAHPLRRRPAAARTLGAFVARLVLTFVLGLSWTAGAKSYEAEAETAEVLAEGGEIDAREAPARRGVRRDDTAVTVPATRMLTWPTVPRRIAPARVVPVLGRWARPRPPSPRDDDDDDERTIG